MFFQLWLFSSPLFPLHLRSFRTSFNYPLLRNISQGQEGSVGIASSMYCPFLLRWTLNLPEIAPRGFHLPMSPLWNKIHIPYPRHRLLKNLEVIMDPWVTADSRCWIFSSSTGKKKKRWKFIFFSSHSGIICLYIAIILQIGCSICFIITLITVSVLSPGKQTKSDPDLDETAVLMFI